MSRPNVLFWMFVGESIALKFEWVSTPGAAQYLIGAAGALLIHWFSGLRS